MDYSQAVQRLSNHANAPGSTLPTGESFLFVLWQAERGAPTPDLERLFDDILSCFEVLNHALNTNHPSETVLGKADVLPRSLVADVSSILDKGWHYVLRWASSQKFSEPFRNELAAMLEQIGIAWNAVLAGDIDDIRVDVQTEFLARRNQQIGGN